MNTKMKIQNNASLKFFLLLTIFFGLHADVLHAAEFSSESEKDYTLRSIGQLQVTNPKGDISIQGWALDKIRIKFKKRVTADNPDQAKRLLDTLDYRFSLSNKDKDIEISAQYGEKLTIRERLQEKENPKLHADMVILAPSTLKLQIWSVEGKVTLKGWNANTQIRANRGAVKVEGLKSDQLGLTCAACSVQLKNIRSSIRIVGGAGQLEFNQTHGKTIYVETDTGPIKLFRVSGDQLYVSKRAAIDGQFLTGKVEFSAEEANVDLREISGFLSGNVETGNITAKVRAWKFLDKAVLETLKGNIDLTLPRNFSGDVDFWSLNGNTQVDFQVQKVQDQSAIGPEPANHLVGRIREGGELLKLYTDQGLSLIHI